MIQLKFNISDCKNDVKNRFMTILNSNPMLLIIRTKWLYIF